ncbi:MAG: GNAT family N-acetyltransferase, partial [Granulosicoccaceae bacterium]
MQVLIRPIRQSDVASLCDIFNHPCVVRNISQLPYATEEQWQKRLLCDANNITLVADHKGAAQGSITLAAETNMRRKHVASLAVAVNPAYHNQGIGTQLLDAAMALADEWMNIARLELGVFTSNRSAIKLYHRFGFAIEGEARAYAYGE